VVKVGLGNQVTTNSSACTRKSILMAYERIKSGLANRMLAGSTSDSGPYIWVVLMPCVSVLLNIIILRAGHERNASGFVPEVEQVLSFEDRLFRGVRIYAEVLGGNINSGGQRGLGTMTLKSDSSSKMHNKRNGQCWNQADEVDTIGH
jgi:hypothetical protein